MSPKDPFLGRSVLDGQFEIVQKIGTGGMGSVYKASQPAMNRMVAIKILHPKLAGRKDLVSRFKREARAMSQLTHPNTAKVFMFGELPEDGSLYIVMELLEGRNLNQTVRKEGPMTVDRAVPILVAVCGALEEAHQLGIVHRDLKPENIFLCQQAGLKDFPKVLDFGLAKVTERQMQPGSLILTQEGMVFGTPEFMSPEQAQGQTLDARSDLYSLAIILYEMLTGKLPFNARSPMEHIQGHVMHAPIPLSQRVPGLTFHPGLDQVLQRALAKKPENRHTTAMELAEALRPYADPRLPLPAGYGAPMAPTMPNLPQLAPPPGLLSGAPASAPVPSGAPVQSAGPRPVVASGSTGVLIVVIVALTCLAAGVVLAVLVMQLVLR